MCLCVYVWKGVTCGNGFKFICLCVWRGSCVETASGFSVVCLCVSMIKKGAMGAHSFHFMCCMCVFFISVCVCVCVCQWLCSVLETRRGVVRRGAVPRGGTTTKSQQGHIPQGAGWQTEGPAWINSTTLFLSAVPLQARTHTHTHTCTHTHTHTHTHKHITNSITNSVHMQIHTCRQIHK